MVLIDKGKIVYQRYKDTGPETEFNSWSMAKSITNILVGQALCRGDIKSLNDKAYEYVPDIKGTAYGDSTIRELLTMTSGAPDPGNFGGEMRGSNFELTRGFKSQKDFIHRDGAIQGQRGIFAYDGLHSDTLGLVLDSLKGRKVYVQDFLNQAGVEHESHWLTDKDNAINAAYGFGLKLDDWAKVTQLSMDMLNGRVEIPNKQCVKKFMEDGTSPIISPSAMKNLGYQSYYGWGYTWTHPVIKNGYAWQGAYGQKVWVDPVHERILIRFGHYRSKEQSDNMGKFFQMWRNGYYEGTVLKDWSAR